MHKGNKELNTLMRLSGESLKIPPHICGFRPNHTKILWAAADMEGHVGKDGSFYMLGFRFFFLFLFFFTPKYILWI